MAVVSQIVELIALEFRYQLILACQGVILIEPVVSSHPVAAYLVSVDKFHGCRSCRVGYDFAMGIEAIDAVTLHGAPDGTVVTLADCCHGGAQAYFLSRKAPAAES